MRPELQKKLYEKYPSLYKEHVLPMSQTCMCWGFECGDGWFQLLDELSAELTKEYPEVVANQVKEKYGTLRFYTNNAPEGAYKLIEEAEAASGITCEVCGAPGKIRGGSWVSVRCEKCLKQ